MLESARKSARVVNRPPAQSWQRFGHFARGSARHEFFRFFSDTLT